jgi:uncharacterized protein (TIRG00374 family)
MRKKIKSASLQLLKVLFSFLLIYWLIASGRLDFRSLSALLQPLYLIPGLLCVAVSISFGTERWRRFLASQKIEVPFFTALKLTLIGLFFNFAFPGGVGGDLVKGYYITQTSPHAKLDAAVSVLVDRLIGLLAMSLIALILLLYKWELVVQQKQLMLIFYAVVAVNLGSFFVWAHIFSHRLNELGWIEKILRFLPKHDSLIRTYHAVTSYRHTKQVFLPALLLSFVGQFVGILFFVFAGQGLGYTDVPMSTYFVVVPIAFMVQSLPLSPAGVGVGQTASYFLFNLLAPGSGPLGAASTTAYQIASFLFGLIGAYFYLGISKKLKNPNPALLQTEDIP